MRYLWMLLLCLSLVQCDDDEETGSKTGSDSDRLLNLKVSADPEAEQKFTIAITLEDKDGKTITEGDDADSKVVISWRCSADADWNEEKEGLEKGEINVEIKLPAGKKLNDCTFKVVHADEDSNIKGAECVGDKCTDDDADSGDDDVDDDSATCKSLKSARNTCVSPNVYDTAKNEVAAAAGSFKATCCKAPVVSPPDATPPDDTDPPGTPPVDPPPDPNPPVPPAPPAPPAATTCGALQTAGSVCGTGKEYIAAAATKSATAANFVARCCRNIQPRVAVTSRNIKSAKFTQSVDNDLGAYEFTLRVSNASATVKLDSCDSGTMFLHRNDTITKVPPAGTTVAVGNHTAFVVGSKASCRVLYGSGNTNTGATFGVPMNIDYVGTPVYAMKGIMLGKYTRTQSSVTRVALTLQPILRNRGTDDEVESAPWDPNLIYMSVDGGQTWKKASGYQGPGGGRCDTSSSPCWLNFADNWNALDNWSTTTSSNNQVLIKYNRYHDEHNVWYYDGDNE